MSDGKPARDPKTGHFLPGNSGGPGRPPGGANLKSAIDRMMREQVRGSEDPRSAAEQVAEKLILDAVKGDTEARKLLVDRYWPKTSRHEAVPPTLLRDFFSGVFEEEDADEDDAPEQYDA